jgi:hypothetical protein
MHAPRDWVQKVVARAFPPAAELRVTFERLDGYAWHIEPFRPDSTSRAIAAALRQAVTATLASLDPLDAIALLDRLHANSPVRFEVRVDRADADLSALLADGSELLARFFRSRSDPELLLVQARALSMSLTLRSPSLGCRGPTECPVCGDATSITREVYPGADGCTGCGAMFVGQRR